MKRAGIQLGLWCISFGLCTGCSVQSSQVQTASRLLPSFNFVQQSIEKKAAPYAWQLQFAGGEYTVYPVGVTGGIVFANRGGIRVNFDGEAIVSVQGLPGALGTYLIRRSGDGRWYERAGTEASWLRCTPRREWRLSADRYGWRIDCLGRLQGRETLAQHNVELDAAGDLRRIEITLAPGLAPLTLVRQRP